MRMQGVKLLDPLAWTCQVEWLVVPAQDCPDPAAESRIIVSHFRKAHEPWSPVRAFVRPVQVRRSRRRVLFRQESGLSY
jgi:hypothetical protein